MHNMKNIKSTLGLFVYIPLGVNVSSRAYQYVSVVSICLSVRICSFYLLISIVYLILFTIYVRSYANIIYSI